MDEEIKRKKCAMPNCKSNANKRGKGTGHGKFKKWCNYHCKRGKQERLEYVAQNNLINQ